MTTTVTSEQVRDGLGEIINRVQYQHEWVIVTRRGKPVAAFVSLEDLEVLEQVLDALDDAEDLPIVKARLAEYHETGEAIPLEEVAARYGL